MSSAAIGDFLHRALAGGALEVGELEVKARAAGLLGERQEIQHAKLFKKAKKAMGIRSIRAGFGSSGKWAWLMPPPAPRIAITASTVDAKERPSIRAEKAPARAPAEPKSRAVVRAWLEGVQRLEYLRSPPAVPGLRWHLFLGDCHSFLTSSENWAERAATLGWSALALFGCHRSRPLEHLGSAGLLWVVNGSAYVLLHHLLGEVNGRRGAWGHAIGGMGAVTQAMAKAACEHGVSIGVGRGVREIMVERGRAVGVVLDDGTPIRARVVVANVNPQHLLRDLVPRGAISPAIMKCVKRWKAGSGSFRMNVALSKLPVFSALPAAGHHHSAGLSWRRLILYGPSLSRLCPVWLEPEANYRNTDPFNSRRLPRTAWRARSRPILSARYPAVYQRHLVG